MQDHEPSATGSIWSEDLAGGQLWKAPASSFPWDLQSPDDVDLAPRNPNVHRTRVILLSVLALAATSFVLGWTGGLNWPEFALELGFGPLVQKEIASETRPSAGINAVRKTSASALQTQSSAASVISVRPPASSPGGVHHSTDWTGTISPSARTNASPASIAVREHSEPPPLGPAPETRPTTIPGWTVIEVRDGAAVLEGPDGIRVARRGETVPGLGHVDSIVRWGSRLIVATTNGLISTP